MMLGLSVLYQLLLTFMLFQVSIIPYFQIDKWQTKSQMREYVAYLDPNLGVPLPEKSYAENCSMDPMNVWVLLYLKYK